MCEANVNGVMNNNTQRQTSERAASNAKQKQLVSFPMHANTIPCAISPIAAMPSPTQTDALLATTPIIAVIVTCQQSTRHTREIRGGHEERRRGVRRVGGVV